MPIKKKLINFKKLANFDTALQKGNILSTSIVFIDDTLKIWTHGVYFSSLKEVLDKYSELSQTITDEATNGKKYVDDQIGTLDSEINVVKTDLATETSERKSKDSALESKIDTETSRAQEAEANRYTKNETYTKEEVNNLITTPNQEYVSVTATDQTTAVTDVLPAIGLADTVYRVGNWDGSQYDVTKYSEYAWNGKDYVHLSTKTGEASAASNVTYNNSDSKLDATNVQQAVDEVRKRSNYNDGDTIIDFNTIHLITDNPEFVCVAVDVNEKILYGIKTDGQPYFGVGCPQQVKDYIDKQINKILGTDDVSSAIDSLKEIEAFLKDFTNSDTLKALLDTKANKEDVDNTIAAVNADIADNKQAIKNIKNKAFYTTKKDIDFSASVLVKYYGVFTVGSEVMINESNDPSHARHVIVPIAEGDLITYENTFYANNQVMAFLDIDNKVISIVTKNTAKFKVSATAPEGSVSVFLNMHPGFDKSGSIVHESLKVDIKQEQQVPCLKFGYSDLGCVNIATPIFDYNVIISYGQSLSVGDGTINEDTNSPQNCYMLGDTPFNASSYLVKAELKRLHVNSGRSSFTPGISATSHIASILNRIQNTNSKKFIALGGGNGGYSVAQLMDKARYVDVNTNEFYFPNLKTYEPYKNLFAALKRIKQIADSENKTCGVIAFVWIQGEGDAWGNGNFKTDTTTCSCAGNKDEWLKRVRQLHKDVADDLNTYLGQDVSPAWFIHNIQGGFIPKYSGVLEAQTEIIDNIDYFSVNPAYQLPNLKDQHLTGNGYRWYGELIAKSILDVILHNKEPYVVRIKDAHIMGDKKSVVLYFSVPVPPLKHDRQIQPEMKNAGFYVTDLNGKELNINKIDIYADFIILHLESQIENGIYIEYATNTSKSESDADVVGAGNICDSALSLSYYTNAEEIGSSSNPVQYVPKSESGDTLVGKRYSLNNYCIPFRILCNL